VGPGQRGLREDIEAALRANDRGRAVRAAVEAVSSGRIDVSTLYRDVLFPIMSETGDAWQRGERHVWEEHLTSAAVRTIVELVYPAVLKQKAAAPPTGRSVLLACPPEETRDLGLRMVADRFDMAGWTTYLLGADTPREEIAAGARALAVDAVVLSSSTHFHRLALRHLVDWLKAELPEVKVWVGGPAFAHGAARWTADEVLDIDAVLGPASPREEDAAVFEWTPLESESAADGEDD
jgi:methanogenic corrinoid protein MtbC1